MAIEYINQFLDAAMACILVVLLTTIYWVRKYNRLAPATINFYTKNGPIVLDIEPTEFAGTIGSVIKVGQFDYIVFNISVIAGVVTVYIKPIIDVDVQRV